MISDNLNESELLNASSLDPEALELDGDALAEAIIYSLDAVLAADAV